MNGRAAEQETWNALLREQVEWHWLHQVRERLAGLSDEEYFWEPVPGCWSLRRGARARRRYRADPDP